MSESKELARLLNKGCCIRATVKGEVTPDLEGLLIDGKPNCAEKCTKCKHEFEEELHPLEKMMNEIYHCKTVKGLKELRYESIKYGGRTAITHGSSNTDECLRAEGKEGWIV